MAIKCIVILAALFAIFIVVGFFIPTGSVRIVRFEKNEIIPIDLSVTTHVKIKTIDNLKSEDFKLVIQYQNGSEVKLKSMPEYREEKSLVFKMPEYTRDNNIYDLATLLIPEDANLEYSEITVASLKSFNYFLCEKFNQLLIAKR